MCLICDRINMIKDGTNPYFVKELETGYVVIGDNQHFKGYSIFLCKEHKTELFQLDYSTKMKFLEEMSVVAEAVSTAFDAEKMNYELLGNGDTHLHWHLFPRKSGDIENYENKPFVLYTEYFSPVPCFFCRCRCIHGNSHLFIQSGGIVGDCTFRNRL